jgi:hypothetical protein
MLLGYAPKFAAQIPRSASDEKPARVFEIFRRPGYRTEWLIAVKGLG